MSLLFNMLSRFVIALLPRSKHLLISWLQLPSAVILEPKKIKSITVYIFSLPICHEVMGLDAMILVFECRVLSQLFHFPLSPSSKCSLVPHHRYYLYFKITLTIYYSSPQPKCNFSESRDLADVITAVSIICPALL